MVAVYLTLLPDLKADCRTPPSRVGLDIHKQIHRRFCLSSRTRGRFLDKRTLCHLPYSPWLGPNQRRTPELRSSPPSPEAASPRTPTTRRVLYIRTSLPKGGTPQPRRVVRRGLRVKG